MISPDNADKFLKAFEEKFGDDYTTFAMAVVPTIPLGCSWGFFTDKQFEDFHVAANKLPEGISVFQVTGGWLVFADYGLLVERLRQVAPIFTPETLRSADQHRVDSQKRLAKHLAKGYPEVRLGFFSMNESPTITINGQSYPAFNVDYGTLCEFAGQYGYRLVFGDSALDPDQALGYAQEALKYCRLAPSGNSLLMVLRK